MRKLLWKEWHEQAWKVAFGCVVLSATAAIGLHARMVADADMVYAVCALGVTLMPVLAATGLVPAERADGALESLLALPIAPSRVLAAKTALGLVLCVAPLAAAAVVSVAIAGGRETYAADMLGVYARSALSAVAVFAWMFALTIRLPNEARAGLIAVGVLILWGLGSLGLGVKELRPVGFAASPFAFVWRPTFDDELGPWPRWWVIVVVQLVLLAGLWGLAVRQFARPTAR